MTGWHYIAEDLILWWGWWWLGELLEWPSRYEAWQNSHLTP